MAAVVEDDAASVAASMVVESSTLVSIVGVVVGVEVISGVVVDVTVGSIDALVVVAVLVALL